MLMNPNKGETAVHSCRCLGDMAVRMRELLARPWVDVCLPQGVRSYGVEMSGIERSSFDARVWVLPKRQNKMAGIILDRQREFYLANVNHYHVAFIYCEQ